jgi:hypothetical protein
VIKGVSNNELGKLGELLLLGKHINKEAVISEKGSFCDHIGKQCLLGRNMMCGYLFRAKDTNNIKITNVFPSNNNHALNNCILTRQIFLFVEYL